MSLINHTVDFFNQKEGNPFWRVVVRLDENTPFNPEQFAKTYQFPDFIGPAKIKDKREIMTAMEYRGKIYPTK